MHSQMVFERRGICKLLPAVAAGVRLLTCVNSRVLLHVDARAEAFVTGVAFERLFPGVNPSMQVEIITPVERLSANFAFVRLLDGVNYYVFLQIPTLPEHCPTSVAFVSLFNGVGFHMKFIVFHISHDFTTLVTLVRVIIILDTTT